MATIYIALHYMALLHFEWADQRKHCANIYHASLELRHYVDTGIVWLKLPKAHPLSSNLKRSLL